MYVLAIGYSNIRITFTYTESEVAMVEKFDYYDILTVVVPGVLLVAWIPFCFPNMLSLGDVPHFPDAFWVFVLTATAVFLGQLLQAIASLLEPLLYWSWGGRPSDQAFARGLRGYLAKDTASRIKQALYASTQESGHSAFVCAMQLADSTEKTRSPRFNALYAYHRSLLWLVVVALALLFISGFAGRAALWPTRQLAAVLIALGALAVLLWHRTKQRAFYYVREVLLTADRVLRSEHPAKESHNA